MAPVLRQGLSSSRLLVGGGSADPTAWFAGLVDPENADRITAGACQNHALALFATDDSWFEIGDDDDLGSDEAFRIVMSLYAGADLAAIRSAVIQLDLEQSIGIGVQFGGLDRGDPQIYLSEDIEGD